VSAVGAVRGFSRESGEYNKAPERIRKEHVVRMFGRSIPVGQLQSPLATANM